MVHHPSLAPCSCLLPLSFALLLIMPTRGSTCRRATDEDEPPMQLQTKYSRRRALMTIDEEEPTPLSKHQKREGSHRPRVGIGGASSSSGQPRDLGSLRGAPPGQSGDPGPGGGLLGGPSHDAEGEFNQFVKKLYLRRHGKTL